MPSMSCWYIQVDDWELRLHCLRSGELFRCTCRNGVQSMPIYLPQFRCGQHIKFVMLPYTLRWSLFRQPAQLRR